MPLAFSTLGCPGASVAEVIEIAQASGARGVELRSAAGEFVHPDMDGAQRATVAAALADAGLSVVTLASYVRICAADSFTDDAAAAASDPSDNPAAESDANDPVLAELLAAVDLAADLAVGNTVGTAQLRVFPGAGLPPCETGQPPSQELLAADLRGARRLNAAAARARARGVTILLETHDSHPRASDLSRILAHVAETAPVKVIWDLMHPWRYDESPQRTAELLAHSLAYAQYKDGVRTPGAHDVVLALPGDGELPLVTMNALVAEIAAAQGIQDPWVSLEWERAWYPHLPPLAEALESLKKVLTH